MLTRGYEIITVTKEHILRYRGLEIVDVKTHTQKKITKRHTITIWWQRYRTKEKINLITRGRKLLSRGKSCVCFLN